MTQVAKDTADSNLYRIRLKLPNSRLLLLPFYIFNYEKNLPAINRDKEALERFAADYREIFRLLDEEQVKGNLSEMSYGAIIPSLTPKKPQTQLHQGIAAIFLPREMRI